MEGGGSGDIRDPFDDAVGLDEAHVEGGREEGREKGRARGREEGRRIGTLKV